MLDSFFIALTEKHRHLPGIFRICCCSYVFISFISMPCDCSVCKYRGKDSTGKKITYLKSVCVRVCACFLHVNINPVQ